MLIPLSVPNISCNFEVRLGMTPLANINQLKNFIMYITNPFQTLKSPKGEKIFIAIGTTDTAAWAEDSTPFITPMQTQRDFSDNGFAEEWKTANSLAVGETLKCDDYEGVIVMRLQ